MFATIFTYDDYLVHPALLFWLQRAGLDSDQISFEPSNGRHVPSDYNRGVAKALRQDADTFIFADRDIYPTPDSDPILESKLDLVSIEYPTECGDESWGDGGFHCGLWIAKREVITGIGLPLFRWNLNADETGLMECTCNVLADKARKLGYTVGHAGEAGHTPRPTGNAKSLRIKI